MSQPWRRRVLALADPLVYLLALAISFVLGGLILWVEGSDPGRDYALMLNGAFGSSFNLGNSMVKAVPVLCTGLAFALAARTGLINIGAEGQFLLGGIGGTLVAAGLPGLPAVLHVPLALLGGLVGGGLWGGLAGFLKVRFRVNEVISTVMLNYIALYLVSYLVNGPMQEAGGTLPQTAPVAATARLAIIWPGTPLHAGFLVAVAAAAAGHLLLFRTVPGFAMRSVGHNRRAALLSGINVAGMMSLSMVVSGAVAGLGGAIEIMGVQTRMISNFSSGYGYDGIAVSVIGGNLPLGTVLAALFIGALRSGADLMQLTAGVPIQMVYVVEGTIIVLLLCVNTWLGPLRHRLLPGTAGEPSAATPPDIAAKAAEWTME
jgi:simple sugar transport system permease protein